MNVETEHALINVMELFVLQPKDVRMEFVFQFLVLHVSLLKNVGMENVWTSVMTWCVLQLRNVKTGSVYLSKSLVQNFVKLAMNVETEYV
jgi:hypothetical protein